MAQEPISTWGTWLQANGFECMKKELSERLGINNIEDVAEISKYDIKEFFETLKKENNPMLDKMPLMKRIDFLQRLSKLAEKQKDLKTQNQAITKTLRNEYGYIDKSQVLLNEYINVTFNFTNYKNTPQASKYPLNLNDAWIGIVPPIDSKLEYSNDAVDINYFHIRKLNGNSQLKATQCGKFEIRMFSTDSPFGHMIGSGIPIQICSDAMKFEKKMDPEEEFLSIVCDVNNFDHYNDLNHKSNQFIQTPIDLKNKDELYNALTLASKRAFHSSFIEISKNIEQGKGWGKHKVLVPNGDIKTRELNGNILIRGKVKFYKNKNNESDTFETYVYYDAKCFGPLSDIPSVQTESQDEMKYPNQSDKLNEISKLIETNMFNVLENSGLDIENMNDNIKLEYLQVFAESASNLTKNYLSKINETSNLNKNIAKIMYNRETVIPELTLKEMKVVINTTKPEQSSRAFFTGALVAGEFVDGQRSKVYVIDEYSEYVGQGNYPDNSLAFPKAVAATFDGIAIDKNTRVIIYEKNNFEGKILWDKTGPAIINNGKWKNTATLSSVNTEIYKDKELQNNFPCNVREWSQSDMHKWSYGSLRVISNNFQN